MIKSRHGEWPVIRKFDCHVLDTAYEGGGGFFTVFPISPKEYRDKHPTQARVNIRKDRQFTHFDITNDYGGVDTVSISNDETEAIAKATTSAIEQGLYTPTT